MAKVKAWRQGSPGEPSFPHDFEIVKQCVLQWTDIVSNHNKYYGLELHQAGSQYRVFTHYGRTDDLENNPDAGARESRYYDDLPSADQCYRSIYNEKTGPAKGYQEVALASSKIGSHKARGASAGAVDDKTLQRIEGEKQKRAAVPKSTLPPGVQELIQYIYEEATTALTTTVAAKITAQGIETPLGVLTIGQIEKGETILLQLYHLFQSLEGEAADSSTRRQLERLSGDFFTTIPHRVGRTRAAMQAAVIDSLAEFEQKQETLQLMKDMLEVNGSTGGKVLYDAEVDGRYKALGCQIGWLEPGSSGFRELAGFVEKSQVKTKNIRVKNVYTLKRAGEHEGFLENVGNHKMLFHGSRIKNWVGILSRGILLPKIVVSMGVKRTDAGWLGNGVYFGDAICTSTFYTTPGKRGTRLVSVARVAMGKVAEFRKITYGLNAPPAGFDSCHGVRHKLLAPSQFADDEYVVYRREQQRLEYLVEISA